RGSVLPPARPADRSAEPRRAARRHSAARSAHLPCSVPAPWLPHAHPGPPGDPRLLRGRLAGQRPRAGQRHRSRSRPRKRRRLGARARAPRVPARRSLAHALRAGDLPRSYRAVPAPLPARVPRGQQLEHRRDRSPARPRALARLQPDRRAQAPPGKLTSGDDSRAVAGHVGRATHANRCPAHHLHRGQIMTSESTTSLTATPEPVTLYYQPGFFGRFVPPVAPSEGGLPRDYEPNILPKVKLWITHPAGLGYDLRAAIEVDLSHTPK